jgi:hypothetical protein
MSEAAGVPGGEFQMLLVEPMSALRWWPTNPPTTLRWDLGDHATCSEPDVLAGRARMV